MSKTHLVSLGIGYENGTPVSTFVAPLENRPPHRFRWLSFQAWWDAVVIETPKGLTLSRGELVLSLAEQDGGTHVDPVLSEKYGAFSRENAVGWRTPTGVPLGLEQA